MFANKVVLITGASSGIGEATVVLFAKEGAHVVLVGRNEDRLRKVAGECAKFGVEPLAIRADVSIDDEARGIVNQTIDRFKKLDVLVNNAGVMRCARILDENVLEAYDEVMAINLRAAFHITSLAAPHLIKSKGNIINVSSVASSTNVGPGYVPYTVSKAGMDHFSRGVALELAPHGVRVNTVNPGPVKTQLFNGTGGSKAFDELTKSTALKKASDSEEVAHLILYLASDKAKSMTGSRYVIDNGFQLSN